MKTVVYAPDGVAFSDEECERAARLFLALPSEQQAEIRVSTSNFVLAVRALVAENLFSWNDVQFKYNDLIIPVHQYGTLPHWPQGFCDMDQKLLSRIIRSRFPKKGD